MENNKILIADNINYGIVKEYYEDNEKYIFIINNRNILFPKIKYNLNITKKYYEMNFNWMPSFH